MKMGSIYAAMLAVACIGCSGKMPANLGVREGMLMPCPDKPNCVSTQSDDQANRVNPLTYTTSLGEARIKLVGILASMKRIRIVSEQDNYIHAECRSFLFRFVDDLECYFDDEGKNIHLRSASRLGNYDFGVNRRRAEQIRKRFLSND